MESRVFSVDKQGANRYDNNMQNMFSRIKRESLAQSVAKQIVSLIEEGYLSVGDRLPPERELCERFGVSRTALREGITSLTHIGILESIGGSGVYVRNALPEAVLKRKMEAFRISERSVDDLAELREALESFIGELACERATRENIKKLRDVVNRMEKRARAGESLVLEDLEFHKELALASHNEFVSVLLESIAPFIVRWIWAREELTSPEEVVALHHRITGELENRELEGVREAIKGHFRHTRMIIRKAREKSLRP